MMFSDAICEVSGLLSNMLIYLVNMYTFNEFPHWPAERRQIEHDWYVVKSIESQIAIKLKIQY
jgi:hypothetical protein